MISPHFTLFPSPPLATSPLAQITTSKFHIFQRWPSFIPFVLMDRIPFGVCWLAKHQMKDKSRPGLAFL